MERLRDQRDSSRGYRLKVWFHQMVKMVLRGVQHPDVRSAMFPSSAILEEMFPSDRDGNDIRRRYAISTIPGFKWRKGDVATFSGDRGSIREEYMLRHFLGFK